MPSEGSIGQDQCTACTALPDCAKVACTNATDSQCVVALSTNEAQVNLGPAEMSAEGANVSLNGTDGNSSNTTSTTTEGKKDDDKKDDDKKKDDKPIPIWMKILVLLGIPTGVAILAAVAGGVWYFFFGGREYLNSEARGTGSDEFE